MKSIAFALLSFTALCAYAAKTVYVTDNLEILLRSGQGTQFKIIANLKTGTRLTQLKANSESGWTQVKLEDGRQGWVLTRFLTLNPVARSQLVKTNETLDKLRDEYTKIKDELDLINASNSENLAQNKKLSTEKDQLIREVTSIRHASTNAVQILAERDQLQERVISLERQLQTVKRNKQTLQDSSEQDWFMIGAGVLFGGIILGLILPKMSWRKKTSSWDSF